MHHRGQDEGEVEASHMRRPCSEQTTDDPVSVYFQRGELVYIVGLGR
jgi:hypothetical protein